MSKFLLQLLLLLVCLPNNAAGNLRFTVNADKEQISSTIALAYAGNQTNSGDPYLEWALRDYPFPSPEMRRSFFYYLVYDQFAHQRRSNTFTLSLQYSNNVIGSVVTVEEFDPVEAAQRIESLRGKWDELWWHAKTTKEAMQEFKANGPRGLYRAPRHLLDVLGRKDYKYSFLSYSTATEWHIQYGPKESHWYINMVATLPLVQGQGHGRTILNKLCEIADQMSQSMYLEATETRRVFFEKFGFVVKHTEQMMDPKYPKISHPMHLMVRAATPDLPTQQKSFPFFVTNE